MLHLVRQLYPDVPAVFVNTGLEYPEIVKFVKTFDNVMMLRPDMNFKKVIEKYGYPVVSKEVSQIIMEARRGVASNGKFYSYRLRQLEGTRKEEDGALSSYNIPQWKFLLDAPFSISHKCCYIMKKTPFRKYGLKTGNKPYTGMMAHESRLRTSNYLRHGCNSFTGQATSQPMAFWTEQDIYRYILQNNLPIADVYGEIVPADMFGYELKTTGADRTGCMFCMFGAHLEKYPNRFQRMKVTHPKLWAYCVDKLGLREVLEYINVPYE